MFDPLYLLMFLPAWLAGLYFLHVARRLRQEAENRRVSATANNRREP